MFKLGLNPGWKKTAGRRWRPCLRGGHHSRYCIWMVACMQLAVIQMPTIWPTRLRHLMSDDKNGRRDQFCRIHVHSMAQLVRLRTSEFDWVIERIELRLKINTNIIYLLYIGYESSACFDASGGGCMILKYVNKR